MILWNLHKRRAARAGLNNSLNQGLHCMDLDLLNTLQILEDELFQEKAIHGLVALPSDDFERLVCVGVDGLARAVQNEAASAWNEQTMTMAREHIEAMKQHALACLGKNSSPQLACGPHGLAVLPAALE